MALVAPPPPCRADRVGYELSAQGATQGLLIHLGVRSPRACRLPARPAVVLLVDGRPASVRRQTLKLGSESRPRTVVGRGRGAYAFLRWKNWCGARGSLALRITLGGRTVVRTLAAAPPVCASASSPSSLGVSIFVRA